MSMPVMSYSHNNSALHTTFFLSFQLGEYASRRREGVYVIYGVAYQIFYILLTTLALLAEQEMPGLCR
jgi:hypothetical protein